MPLTKPLIVQYLQHKKIAKDFANYLDLYEKYRTDYRVGDILAGNYTKGAVEKLQEAPFDERLSVMGLLLSRLTEDFTAAYDKDLQTVQLHGVLKEIKDVSQALTASKPLGKLSQNPAWKKSRASTTEKRKPDCWINTAHRHTLPPSRPWKAMCRQPKPQDFGKKTTYSA